MPRIAIDARKIQDFGIGSYLQHLLADLAGIDSPHEFVVILPPREALPAASPRLTAIACASPSYGLAEHFSIAWIARRAGASLLHEPHYVLPALWRGPAVVTIHDLIHLRFPQYLPNRMALHYARAMIHRSLRRATRILTVSEFSKHDILELVGGDPARIVVLPNRVDELFFGQRSAEDLARTRERWRLPERFVLYAGNVKPHKNLERLLRAFALARQRVPEARLVLVGNDLARYHALRRLAAELGIAEQVRALGFLPREELSSIYRLATVFAYPSLWEGFGLPPLEAMAAGVPVVSSNRASLPEVLGDAALLFDPLLVEAQAEAMAAVLGDPVLAADLRQRGLRQAERFRGEGSTRAVLNVYDEAMREGR